MTRVRHLEVLKMIRDDMEADVIRLGRAPFTGATVGEIHGTLAAAVAAVAALADLLAAHVSEHVEAES